MSKWVKSTTLPCGCYIKVRANWKGSYPSDRKVYVQCREGHKREATQEDQDFGNYFDNFVDGRGY